MPVQMISSRFKWAIFFVFGIYACASKPQPIPDNTPIIVFALEAHSFTEAVKVAQRHNPRMRTAIRAGVSFEHLPPGLKCSVLDEPVTGNAASSANSSQRIIANDTDGYRRAYEGIGFTPVFRSNGSLDYWGNRTLRNGNPDVSGFVFAIKEAFHEGVDVYQLSRIFVSGYALGAVTSSGGRFWEFEVPAVRSAVTFDKASIIFIGPLRFVPSENNMMTLEWVDRDQQAFLQAIAQASGRPVESIVPAEQYVIDSTDCINTQPLSEPLALIE